MTGIDSYYTPAYIADRLVKFVGKRQVRNTIDFCVGDGNLLKAAARQLDGIELYGTDISYEALQNLAVDCPDFLLSYCDFRDDESVASVRFLRNHQFDLILLNPPFTCKGSIIEHVNLGGQDLKVSTAMLFLMRALRFLSDNGGLYAIMPISIIYSEKDKQAWDYLKKYYHACVLEEPSRVYFSKKCSPNVALVYVGKYEQKGVEFNVLTNFKHLAIQSVTRGSIRMNDIVYSKKRSAVPLIHTTNLQDGTLVNLKKIVLEQEGISGFGVIIPRVCNPNKNKIVILADARQYALSDCVMFLETPTLEDAVEVRNYILTNWENFKMIYKGTGAQYTTLKRVKTIFGLNDN